MNKNRYKILSLLMVLMLVLSSGIVVFANSDTNTTKTNSYKINEFEYYYNIIKNSDKELIEMGYEQDKIDELRAFDPKQYIKEVSKKSVEELKARGYNETQIKTLKDISDVPKDEISEAIIYTIGATVTLDLRETGYVTTGTYTNGTTKAQVQSFWSWDMQPSTQLTDAVAVAWGKELATNTTTSKAYLTWKDASGRVWDTDTVSVADISPNHGCSFEFPVHSGAYGYINSGYAVVNVYNNQQALSDIEFRSEYGHSALLPNISVSFPGGVSISFSTAVLLMDYDFLTI